MFHHFRTLFFIPLLIFGINACAQSITGKILNQEKEPIPSANILLLSSQDSSLVKATASMEDGSFELSDFPPGSYLLKVVAFGFGEKIMAEPVIEEGENSQLGDLVLSAGETSLDEVEISYTKPMVEVHADKTIFNVEGTSNSIGLNALELLRKAPGVTVDSNEKIMVKGRSGVQVYIDGKPSPLSVDDLAIYLKSMQSSAIESFEIITNPSAKFEAAGTAGIINIKLKKNKNFGTNGTVSGGYGVQRYSKYNASLTFNHRNEHWNLFGTYGYNKPKSWNYMYLYRTQNDSVYDQESNNVNDGANHNFKAGVDYFIDRKSTIGVMINGIVGASDFQGTSKTYISGVDDESVNRVLDAQNLSDGSRQNINGNINYHFVDSTGKDLAIDADYGTYVIRNNSFQPNTYYDPSEQVVLDENTYRSITPTDILIYSLKADYEQPALKGKLGFGFKTSVVDTDNAMDFYDVEDDSEILDTTQTFRYNYNENINAAYVNYNCLLKKWTVQAGLRAEQTISSGDLTSYIDVENKNVDRQYLDWFPSAAINYNLNDTNLLSLSYSRRIQRPNYQDLNPFEFKLDELSYERGNPFLKPQYTHSLDLTHTYMYSLNTSLTYSYTLDYFTMITDTTNQEASYIQQRNLGSQDVLSLNISSPIPVKKWLNLFVNAGGGRIHNLADFGDGKNIDLAVWFYNFYGQATINLDKTTSVELSGWYEGPGIWGGTFVNKPMGSLDIAAKKDFAKGKGTLRIAYGDILKTSYWRSTSDFGGLTIAGHGGWESRQFRVNLSYRFGNQEMKVRERKGGADDLGKRVK